MPHPPPKLQRETRAAKVPPRGKSAKATHESGDADELPATLGAIPSRLNAAFSELSGIRAAQITHSIGAASARKPSVQSRPAELRFRAALARSPGKIIGQRPLKYTEPSA